MKKVSAIIVCCLLVVALMAMPVLAAQNAVFTATASKTEVGYGDTFTVTVSVDEIKDLITGAFQLSYDATRFEYVKNAKGLPVKMSDNLVALVDVGDKIALGIIYGAEDQLGETLSGELLVITFKVKDGAPAGAGTFTCTPSATDVNGDVTCTGVNATVTIVCDHTYGGWEKNNADTHKQTCSKCGDVKTEAHKWNAGETTTPAGCATTGVKTYTCTVCSETKTETIPATGKHSYGAWEKNDKDTHKQTCTCGKVNTEAHKWNKGEITTPADCKNDGVKTFTCTVCSETKTETVPATGAHGYDTWTKVDDVNHTAVCTGCGGAAKTEKHTMNAGEITKPATCKETGIKTFTCTAKGCGHTTTEVIPVTEDHNFGEWTAADAENHKRVCSICEKTETEAHKAGTELKSDAESHWYECACGQKMTVTAHVYDHLVGDAEGHAEGCACTALKPGATKVPHTFDEGVITKKPTSKEYGEKTFTCTGCGFKKYEQIDKVTTPNTGDNTLVIPMVILAVLSACGLAVTVVARKRASR